MKQGSVHYKPEELHKLITKYDDTISHVDTILQAEWDEWKCDSIAEIDEIRGGLDAEVIYQSYLNHIKTLSTTNYVKSEPHINSFLGIKWKSAPIITEVVGLEGYELIDEALRIVNKTLPDKVKVVMLSNASVYGSVRVVIEGGRLIVDERRVTLGGVLPAYLSRWSYADKNVYLKIKGTIPQPTESQSYYQEATTTLSSLKRLTSLPNSEFVVLNDEQVGGLNGVVRVYKELTE